MTPTLSLNSTYALAALGALLCGAGGFSQEGTLLTPQFGPPRPMFERPTPKQESMIPLATTVHEHAVIQNIQKREREDPTDLVLPYYKVQLDIPKADRLFRFESEAIFREGLRKEALSAVKPLPIEFPDPKGQDSTTAPTRKNPPASLVVPAHVVCHRRLFFEQPWSERYGQSLGVLQPFVSAGIFYSDVANFPLTLLTSPLDRFECHSDGWSPFFCPTPPTLWARPVASTLYRVTPE